MLTCAPALALSTRELGKGARRVLQTVPSIYTHHTHVCTANLLIGQSIHPLLLHTVNNDKKENDNNALIHYPSWTTLTL
eukprot:14916089-Ditylum_brightwellii.AAC.1